MEIIFWGRPPGMTVNQGDRERFLSVSCHYHQSELWWAERGYTDSPQAHGNCKQSFCFAVVMWIVHHQCPVLLGKVLEGWTRISLPKRQAEPKQNKTNHRSITSESGRGPMCCMSSKVCQCMIPLAPLTFNLASR